MNAIGVLLAIIVIAPLVITGGIAVAMVLPLILPIWGMYWLFTTRHEFKEGERVRLFYLFVGVQFVFPLFYLSMIPVTYLVIWWLVLLAIVGAWMLFHPYFRANALYAEKLAEWNAIKRITPEDATTRYNAKVYFTDNDWLNMFVQSVSADIYKQAYFEAEFPLQSIAFDLKYDHIQLDAWKKVIADFKPQGTDDEKKWRLIADAVRESVVIFVENFPPKLGTGFNVPVMDLMPNVGQTVAHVMSPFFS